MPHSVEDEEAAFRKVDVELPVQRRTATYRRLLSAESDSNIAEWLAAKNYKRMIRSV
jgi:hypothetical protein